MSFVKKKYNIITLCGSIKFKTEFMKVQEKLTLEGNIIFTPNFFSNIKNEIDLDTKKMLDEMHRQKIDMSNKKRPTKVSLIKFQSIFNHIGNR